MYISLHRIQYHEILAEEYGFLLSTLNSFQNQVAYSQVRNVLEMRKPKERIEAPQLHAHALL